MKATRETVAIGEVLGGEKMLRIAICDDDPNMVSLNEKTVRSCLQDCGIGFELTTYTQSSNLLCDITEDGFFYDLILLDIEMPNITGMEMAERIKPFLPNVKIIFITSHVEYAIDANELSIFGYVPKDDLEKRLPAAVTDAAKLIELEAGKEYTIQTNSRLEKIPYRDIIYIVKDGKNAEITSAGKTSKVRKSLQQVYEELNAPEFIFIERGCIVNMIHIVKLSDGMVVLKDDTRLPISRSHLQTVKQEITRFWGAHI